MGQNFMNRNLVGTGRRAVRRIEGGRALPVKKA